MKTRLFLLLCLAILLPALGASAETLLGVVVNGNTGSPINGAAVMLRDQKIQTTTDFNGQFRLTAPDKTGTGDYIVIMCDGYDSFSTQVTGQGNTVNLGEIRLQPVESNNDYYGDLEDLIFDESALDDDEGPRRAWPHLPAPTTTSITTRPRITSAPCTSAIAAWTTNTRACISTA